MKGKTHYALDVRFPTIMRGKQEVFSNRDGLDDVGVAAVDDGDSSVYVIRGKGSHRKLSISDLGHHGFELEFSGGLAPLDGGADVNGDGRDDLVVGSPLAADDRGKVFIVWAKPRP